MRPERTASSRADIGRGGTSGCDDRSRRGGSDSGRRQASGDHRRRPAPSGRRPAYRRCPAGRRGWSTRQRAAEPDVYRHARWQQRVEP